MHQSFNLFSDELRSGNDQTHYLAFLAEFQKVFKNLRLYPETHKLVQLAFEGLAQHCEKLFKQYQSLVFVRIGRKIITPECQLDIDDSRVTDIAKVLEDHQVRKIRFWHGIEERHIVELCRILAMKPIELLEAGGAKFILQQAKISSIEIEIASQSDNSSEAGEAGLSETMAVGNGNRTRWSLGLKKAGINEESFVDYLLHRPTNSAMLQSELQLAAHVFTNPREIAELMLFVATDPDDPDVVSSEVMYNIMQRIENVILMHSDLDEKELTKILMTAARLLPAELRLQLLQYYCEIVSGGGIISSFKLFSFDLPEYFELIWLEFSNDDSLSYLSSLRLSKKTFNELLKYSHRRLSNEAGVDDAMLEDFLDYLEQSVPLDVESTNPTNSGEIKKMPADALKYRIDNLQANLELGYLYVLTALLVNEKEESRILDICVRLARLLDLYLSKQDYNTLIPIFRKFTELEGATVKIFNEVFWGNLSPEQVAGISNLFTKYCAENQQDSAELMLALNKYLPAEFIPNFLLKAIKNKAFHSHRFIRQLLIMGHPVDALCDELLQNGSFDDRLIAFDLLAFSHDDDAEHMLLETMQRRKIGVGSRIGIIYMLASFRGEASRARLLRIAAGVEKFGLSAYVFRCVAVEALGIRRDPEAISCLEAIIGKRNLWRYKHNYELRFGAALALKRINNDTSQQVLEDHIDLLQRTLIKYIFDRVILFFEREFILLKRIILFMIRPVVFAVKTILYGMKYLTGWLRSLILTAFYFIIKFITLSLKMICKMIIYPFCLTGTVLKKIPLFSRMVNRFSIAQQEAEQ